MGRLGLTPAATASTGSLALTEDTADDAIVIDFAADGPLRVITLTEDAAVTFDNVPAGETGRIIEVGYLQGGAGGFAISHAGDVEVGWQGRPPAVDPRAGQVTWVQYRAAAGLVWGIAPQVDPDSRLVNGIIETFSRRGVTGVSTLTSGHIRGSVMTAPVSGPFTKIASWTGATAAGATPTHCYMGVYEVLGYPDSALTLGDLLALTANDTTLWATTHTEYERALAATLELVAGARIMPFCLCITGATAPVVQAQGPVTGTNGHLSIIGKPPRLHVAVTGVAGAPAADGSGYTIGATNQWPYMELRP
jgi:hypothetical protein